MSNGNSNRNKGAQKSGFLEAVGGALGFLDQKKYDDILSELKVIRRP
jgi:hypothetical protein